MKKTLHIVSLNIPYPANYGGIIDIFYRIKALSEMGVEIILHAFEYGREHADELNKYCKEVHYYKRNTGWKSQFTALPYIIYSRKNETLIARLQKDDYPILFEGLHTCYYLGDKRLKDRLKLVRMHNVEHHYYQGLAKNTRKFLLKIYFSFEALRLQRYEKVLKYADYILPVSSTEYDYFRARYGDKIILVRSFHPNQEVIITPEAKPYVLYHGDLSTPENINNAIFLIDKVARKDQSISWLIAGLNPDKTIYRAAEGLSNVTIRANLSSEEMTGYLREALINVLYTSQGVGLKLKLLNAVHNCHYCLANANMLVGSGLDEVCVVVPDDPEGLLTAIRSYIKRDFPADEIEKRKALLSNLLDNRVNAEKIFFLLSQK